MRCRRKSQMSLGRVMTAPASIIRRVVLVRELLVTDEGRPCCTRRGANQSPDSLRRDLALWRSHDAHLIQLVITNWRWAGSSTPFLQDEKPPVLKCYLNISLTQLWLINFAITGSPCSYLLVHLQTVSTRKVRWRDTCRAVRTTKEVWCCFLYVLVSGSEGASRLVLDMLPLLPGSAKCRSIYWCSRKL